MWGLALLSVLVAAMATMPLVYLGLRIAEAPEVATAVLQRPSTTALIVNTLLLAVSTTAAASVVGIAVAYGVARCTRPGWGWSGARLWLVLLTWPIAIPSYVIAYAWLSMAPAVQGFWAAWGILVACSYPYVMLPTYAVLRRMGTAPMEVALSLGTPPLRAWLTTELPRITPASGAGGLLVFLYCLSDFGVVSLVRYETLTRAVYASYRASFDRTAAATLGVVVVVLALLVVAVEQGVRRAANVHVNAATARTPIAAGGRARLTFVACAAVLFTAAVIIPVSAVTYWALFGRQPGDAWALTVQALSTTAMLGIAAGVIAVVGALPLALFNTRSKSRVGESLGAVVMLGHALPGVVLALALVFFGVRYATSLYQTLPMLLIAYWVMNVPKALSVLRGGLASTQRGAVDVAKTLGDSPFRAWVRVVLPEVTPTLGAAGALCAIAVMKELPATLMLRPTGTETLASRLWTHVDTVSFAAAAPYALLLIVVGSLPVLLLAKES